MNKLDENFKLEKVLDAIINYYKLVCVLKLTKDKSLSTFNMLNGNKMIEKLIEDFNNNHINIEGNNYNLANEFFIKVSKATSVHYSINPLLVRDLENISWISEIEDINPDDKLIDTILINSNREVFDNLIANYNIFKLSKYYTRIIMQNYFIRSKRLVKKNNNKDITE